MADSPPDENATRGLEEGMRDSPDGDPRVLFVLNVVLSSVFAYTVLWLTDLVGLTTLTLERFLVFTLVMIAITYVLTR